MKKLFVLGAALSVGLLSASAQDALERTNFGSNWSIGLDGGVATPMSHHAFFGSMRGVAGMHIHKQISPTFGLGVEGQFGVNTSSWTGVKSKTAFDDSYVGLYGTASLFNLFGGYREGRVFDIDAVAGAGWGRKYYNDDAGTDYNYFATRTGLNFNFNTSKHFTISLKPAVVWAMSDNGTPGYKTVKETSASYNRNNAAFEFLVGATYKFGDGFKTVRPYNQAEIDALNGRINELRGDLDASVAALAASEAQSAALAAELQACQNRVPTVVKETTTNNILSSVRYVFFKIGSSKITPDQMPNVEMVAAYMKNHPKSSVVIKGYASPDGNYDFNVKLAAARAESVKNSLIKKYGIKADRIKAEGEGIGNMFTEESWNRVSICTIED